jgi:hypothetical protein
VNATLLAELRAYLTARMTPVTYAQAARDLGGISINNLTQLLETTMEEDVAAARSLIAARVISRTGPLPARGFFDKARSLGCRIGDPASFHAAELAALRKLP